MSKTSPTQRSLAYAKKQGFIAAVVEKWNPHMRIRQDLFGFADLIVLDGKPGSALWQVTTGANVSKRLTKMTDTTEEKAVRIYDKVIAWLKAGNRIEIHGWAKKGPRGKRKTWQLRIIKIRSSEFYGALFIDTPEFEGSNRELEQSSSQHQAL